MHVVNTPYYYYFYGYLETFPRVYGEMTYLFNLDKQVDGVNPSVYGEKKFLIRVSLDPVG